MNQSLHNLLVDIEECREEMIFKANSSSFGDQQVVKLSTKLDELLNQYYKLNLEKQ